MKMIHAALACALLVPSAMSFASPSKTNAISIPVQVTKNGFEPSRIEVKPGQDVTLKVTRVTDVTCAYEILVPSKKIKVALPLNREVKVRVGKLKKGTIKFACGMSMIGGVIVAQ